LSWSVSAAVSPAIPPPTMTMLGPFAARALLAKAVGPPKATAAPTAPERFRNSPRE
jgi:hypothetical protein